VYVAIALSLEAVSARGMMVLASSFNFNPLLTLTIPLFTDDVTAADIDNPPIH
jgi:hypothetical protein